MLWWLTAVFFWVFRGFLLLSEILLRSIPLPVARGAFIVPSFVVALFVLLSSGLQLVQRPQSWIRGRFANWLDLQVISFSFPRPHWRLHGLEVEHHLVIDPISGHIFQEPLDPFGVDLRVGVTVGKALFQKFFHCHFVLALIACTLRHGSITAVVFVIVVSAQKRED